ncbi:MAG: ATP-grasp domain-containing protein [Candidatus Buchananbacteria bacterium]
MKNNGIDLNDKVVLLVNSGSIKKRFILQRLKKLGVKIACLNREKNWATPYVDYWILADNTNHNEAISALKEFLSQNPEVKINGAITFWEDDVLLTSKIIDKFNLIGTPFSVAKKIRNKFLFREFCRQHDLPAPKHILIKSISDIQNLPESFIFPMVIKPAYGASSAYVIKVENKEELTDTYNYIKKNISTETESALNEGLDIFAEEYIEGDEVDIDIVIQNGKIKFYSISDNYQTREPFFVETGQSIPTTLSQKTQQDLVDMAEETLELLGVQNGVIHFEAKASPDGPVPIEVNLRMGGDEVYSFVKGAWSVDLIECAVKISFGIYLPKINRPEMPRKYITGVYFLPDYSGVMSKLEVSTEELQKKKYLEELHFFKKIGDPVLVPPDGYEYIGWITVSGYSIPDAQENLKDALKYVKYEVAKFKPESSIGKTSRKNSFSQAALNSNILVQAAKIERIKRITKENQRNLHIGVAYNPYEENDGKIEQKFAKTGEEIEKILKDRGYKVTLFDFNNGSKVINELKKSDVDLIINACESVNDSPVLKSHSASILDILQIPYTGSNALTISLSTDKIKFKKLLDYHNIPTPSWDYVISSDDKIYENLRYPLMVKPSNTNYSMGISNESVVTSEQQLQDQIGKILTEFKSPVLVEEYIEGDEYDVSIIGSDKDNLQVLPLARTIFKNMPENYWHIHTWDAKWAMTLPYKDIVIQQPPKNLNKKLETLITEIALDTYFIMDCNDYGRVQIRVDENSNPYVLELNPNPSLSEIDSLSNAAKLIGLDYGDLLEDLISMAIKRYKDQPTSFNLPS